MIYPKSSRALLALLKFCGSFGGSCYIRNPHAKILIDDNNLALGQEFAIHLNVHSLSCQFVQLDNGTVRELQNLLDGLLRAFQALFLYSFAVMILI